MPRFGNKGRMPRQVGGHRTNVPRLGSATAFRDSHRQQVRDTQGRFAGGWGFAWQGLEALDSAIYKEWENTQEAIHQGAESLKDEMVTYMKQNAPWEDRSGAARRELQGAVIWEDETHFTIMLGHGKDIYYGIWLEVRFGGRYAIVLPTIRKYAPLINSKIVSPT